MRVHQSAASVVLICLAFICLTFICLSSPAHATTTNLGSAGVDHASGADLSGITAYGWIRSDDPTRVAGGETSFMGGLDTGAILRGYVGFDLSSLTSGDTVNEAIVSLWSQGATTFNANGGVVDIGVTAIHLTQMSNVIGFGDGMSADAAITSSGLPANWNNLNGLYGTSVAQQSANLDTIAFGQEVQFDVTAEIAAAIANGQQRITLGITAPAAETHGARNFFAFGGIGYIKDKCT